MKSLLLAIKKFADIVDLTTLQEDSDIKDVPSSPSSADDLTSSDSPECSVPGITEEDINKIMQFKPALGKNFWVRYIEMANRVSPQKDKISTMKVATIMAQVMKSESGFKPEAVAVRGGRPVAKGLNGMLKNIFELVCKKINRTDVLWENYEKLTAEQQLPFVEGFFKMVGTNPNDTPTSLYVKNFGGFHRTNPKSETGDQVLYAGKQYMESNSDKSKYTDPRYQGIAYEQNKDFDVMFDKDGKMIPDPADPTKPKRKGYITPKDLEYALSGKLRQGLADLKKAK